ncbi:Endoglucanase EG-II [Xylographa trunciseda]|nr:Endoglucanase EG-II [Xylographa trunciseda]
MRGVLADVQFKGVNIAGFDFGCPIDGTCVTTSVYPPLTELNGPDGAGQMAHFTSADGFNLYRLPVGWQYLVNNVLGGPLDPTSFADYDKLVQACLATGSHCLIDIHNYARWNGAIIGQGGPTNEQFAGLWGQLAAKYASESKILFGIMNEPHDLPDINLWATSVQAAVTAIRTAGATSQIILLPGNDYTSAESFVSGGSAAALGTVTNLDGSKTNLVFDVHKYLDSDGSGTNADCVSNQIDTSFSPLATYLRANNRQAILSETGGGSSDSDCLTAMCQALSFLDTNSDVYLGYVGWAAGAFATNYVLSMTPFGSAATGWTDQELVSQCFAMGASGSGSNTSAPASSAATTLMTTASATISTPSTTLGVITTLTTVPSVSSTTDAVPESTSSSTSSASTTATATVASDSTPPAPSQTDPPAPTFSTSTIYTNTYTSALNSSTDAPYTSSSTSAPSTTPTDPSTPSPTAGDTQTVPAASSTPSGFTTMTRPSSTEAAGSEETGDGGDDDSCYL